MRRTSASLQVGKRRGQSLSSSTPYSQGSAGMNLTRTKRLGLRNLHTQPQIRTEVSDWGCTRRRRGERAGAVVRAPGRITSENPGRSTAKRVASGTDLEWGLSDGGKQGVWAAATRRGSKFFDTSCQCPPHRTRTHPQCILAQTALDPENAIATERLEVSIRVVYVKNLHGCGKQDVP